MRITLEPAFILHHRPWRDSSLTLEVFTPTHGRIALVARGARRPKSRLQGLMQPFRPLLISAVGRGEMGTLSGAELRDGAGRALPLQGRAVISGFYLNELLMRLLTRHDPHPRLFAAYETALSQLGAPALDAREEQRALRRFEFALLGEIGYGLVLDREVESGAPIDAERVYDYYPERGPVAVAVAVEAGSDAGVREPRGPAATPAAIRLHGRSLIALARDELDDDGVLREAKHLMRMALGICLGGKPLRSRELFRKQPVKASQEPT